MNRTKEHNELLNAILLAVGSNKNIRVWPRVVGVGRALNSERVMAFGIKGETDIDGIIAPHGKKLAIEVKTGKAVLSSDQKKYRAMILKFGGVHITGRSVEQVLTELSEFL